MARFEHLNVGNINQRMKTLTAAYTIPETDNQVTFHLDLAAGFEAVLPAPKMGKKLKFIVKTAPTGSYTIISKANATIIQGTVIVNAAFVQGIDEDTISFVLNVAIVGDWVELESDGVNWIVSGCGFAAGAITLTDAA